MSELTRYEKAVARRNTALDLRRVGRRNYEIAAAMGISRQRVQQILARTPVPPEQRRAEPDTWIADLRLDLEAALRLINGGALDGAASIVRSRLALLDERFPSA